MKKGTKAWMDFARRDLEAARLSLTPDEDELDLVDAVYIDTRYPSGLGLLPSGFPTKEDAKEILGIAEKLYDETSKRLVK